MVQQVLFQILILLVITNATTLSVNCTLATGNYYVRVENPDGNAGRSTNNIITASTAPIMVLQQQGH